MTSQPNYFLIIPTHILDDERIDDSTAILFGRISSLSNKMGYCFASDKYLAELTRVGEREVRNRLKKLEDCGYIRKETEKQGMGWDRKIIPNFNYERNRCAGSRGTGVPDREEQVCRIQDKQEQNKTPTESCKEQTNSESPSKSLPDPEPVVVVLSDKSEKRELLNPYGFSENALESLMVFPIDQIRNAIQAFEQYKTVSLVSNPSGCVRQAIIERWRPNLTKKERLSQKEKTEESKQSKIQENIHKAKEMISKWMDMFVFKVFEVKISDQVAYLTYPDSCFPLDLSMDGWKETLEYYFENNHPKP
jgi:DNA-binding Lrp family transcriptional regulator